MFLLNVSNQNINFHPSTSNPFKNLEIEGLDPMPRKNWEGRREIGGDRGGSGNADSERRREGGKGEIEREKVPENIYLQCPKT